MPMVLEAVMPDCGHAQLPGSSECLCCRLNQIEADAARYRWLRSRFGNEVIATAYDRGIDNAMLEGREMTVADIKKLFELWQTLSDGR